MESQKSFGNADYRTNTRPHWTRHFILRSRIFITFESVEFGYRIVFISVNILELEVIDTIRERYCSIILKTVKYSFRIFLIYVSLRRRRTALSVSCPCLVFARIFRKILSGVCPVSGFCPDSVCLDSVRCQDSVRIFRKKAFRCLSVRPDKDKTELSGLSLSLSADVWFLYSYNHFIYNYGHRLKLQ